MKLNIKIINLSLAALMLLPSCLRVPSYNPRTLQFMHSKRMHRQVKNNVIIQIKELSEDERAYLFGERIGRLEHKEYTVLYFSIHNLSTSHYTILPDFTDLNFVPYNKIIQQIKTSTLGRIAIAGTGIAGAAIAGTSEMIGISIALTPLLIPYCLLFTPLAVIGGLAGIGIATSFGGKAIKSSVVNNRIKKDLKKKLLHENSSIMPGGFYEGLIVIKNQDFREKFTLNLHAKNSVSGIQFDISL